MNAVKKFFVVVLAFSIVSLSCSLTPQVQGEPTPSQTAAPARQAETTDSSGAVTFEDPSSGEEVVVTILDGGEELQGAEVAYFHGQTNPFEVYLVRDARGLLAMEFYLHNSEHTIEVTRGEIRPLNPEQVEATEGYLTDMGLVSRNTYLETIPNAELQIRMAQLQVAGDVMLFFIGTFWEIGRAAKAFLGAIGDVIGILPEPEDPNIQWDLYQSYDAEWGYTSLVFVESQPPLMQSPTVDVGEDGSVTVSLLGVDPVRYSTTSTQFAGMPDQTIFEGPTEFSDLVYFYGVEGEDGTTVIANEVRQDSVCIQGNCTRTELDLGILPAGKYYLRYQALDEVGNFSLPLEMGVEVERTLAATGVLTGTIAGSDMDRLTLVHFENSTPSVALLDGFEWIVGLTWSPDGSRLAFAVDHTVSQDRYTLELVNADGTGHVVLLSSSDFVVEPVWSPDGGEIAYLCYEWFLQPESFCFYSLETGGIDVITPAPGNPRFQLRLLSWIPDGSGVIFLGNDLEQFPSVEKTYQIDRTGGNMREVPSQEGILSPDSTRAMYGQLDGLHIVDLNSGQDILLIPTTSGWLGPGSTLWSPDGNWIAFTYLGVPENAEACGQQNPPDPPVRCDQDIWIISADGGEPINVSNTPDVSENYLSWGR